MSEKVELLNGVEQDSILKAVLELIKACPFRTVDVGFETLNKDGQSLGIYGISGAVVEKRYITGSFVGIVPFGIILRSNAKTDEQKLEKIEYLSKLSEWLNLEEIEYRGIKYRLEGYPALTGKRKILSIEQKTVPFKDNSNGAGDNDYAVKLEVRYKNMGR